MLAQFTADQLLQDPRFVATLADEVQTALFDGARRTKLSAAITAVLSCRLELHGKAVAQLESLRKELAQDWRKTAGGEGGGPTPTRDLVSMASIALQEVKNGEELVLKTVKLALEEERSRVAAGQAGSPLDAARFSGDAEKLGAGEVPASEREIVRTLLRSMKESVARAAAQKEELEAARAKVVPARVVSTPEPAPSAPPAPPAAESPPVSETPSAASDF